MTPWPAIVALLTRIAEACEALCRRGDRLHGKPLGDANLLTKSELARELRCSEARVAQLVVGLRVIRAGRWPLWLWSDVLARVLSEAESEEAGPGLRIVGLAERDRL